MQTNQRPIWTQLIRPVAALCIALTAIRAVYLRVVNTAAIAGPIAFAPWQSDETRLLAHVPDPRCQVLFLGDSITDFWALTAPDLFAAHFSRYHAENYGVRGDRTDGLLWRIRRGDFDRLHPRAVVLLIGTNNVTRFIGDVEHYRMENTPTQVAAATALIVDELRRRWRGVKVLLVSILPRRLSSDTAQDNDSLRAINALNRAGCNGRDLIYVDVAPRFTMADGAGDLSLLRDGIHPVHSGYKVIAAALDAPLRGALGRAPAARKNPAPEAPSAAGSQGGAGS